ncbi:MAG TPA: hypothetical protein VFM54_01205 [Micromonosporaceae bacterium]|nr:hypothetical protein [Micromonosporaceae bacterium]
MTRSRAKTNGRSSAPERTPDQLAELIKTLGPTNPDLLEVVALTDDATARRFRRNRWSTALQEIAKAATAGVLAAAAFITTQLLDLNVAVGIIAVSVTAAATGAGIGARRLQQRRQNQRRSRARR